MIKIQLINSEASLNSFFNVGNYIYVPGENLSIAFRLFHLERDIRFVAVNPAATITVSFPIKSSTTPLSIVATEIDALDRSMWAISLTPAQTLDLSGSNMEVLYNSDGAGALVYKTVARSALTRTILSGDC